MSFRGAVQNIAQLRGDTIRRLGEEVAMAGNGLAVIGRPPLLSYVVLNDKDTGSRIPLAAGTVISQPFERFWLFHPFKDGGLFRFAVLQGDDWVESPQLPEPLRFSANGWYPTHPWSELSPGLNRGLLQMHNVPRPRVAGGLTNLVQTGLRLARLSSIELYHRTGPRQIVQATLYLMQGCDMLRANAETFGLASAQYSSDTRVVTDSGETVGNVFSQCILENADDGLNDLSDAHRFVLPNCGAVILRRVRFDASQTESVVIPGIDIVLRPSAGLLVVDESPDGGFEGSIGVNVVWTEENL